MTLKQFVDTCNSIKNGSWEFMVYAKDDNNILLFYSESGMYSAWLSIADSKVVRWSVDGTQDFVFSIYVER